jgi:hypothetical protein
MKEIVKLPSEEFEKSDDPKIEEKASLFRESSRRLASLQTRYSARMRPELIGLIIDIESLLESISSDLEDPTTDALRSFGLFQFQLLIERLVNDPVPGV